MSDGSTSPVAPGANPAPGRNLRETVGRARTWTTRRPLIPMLAAAAIGVAIVVALLLWAGGPDYRVLYSNLSDADGGQIISTLEQRGVPYKFAQGGHALLVPADKVYDLRLRLAEQGLPSSGNAGFEIMDKQQFGISQFAEQINYQRGLQGELATSIEALQPVENARVHLALPKDSLFVREQQPAKATVVLKLRAGRALDEGQVNAIVHLVSSSVRDLAPDNVTVVDQTGRLLTHHGADSGLDGTQIAYTHEVENRYQDRIENILVPILGAGNVHAQVTAQLDFNRREETQERYAPNQGDNPATVRSRQVSNSRSDGTGLPGGVPGALTNTPPGAAASPISDPPASGAVAAAKDKKTAKTTEARTLAGSDSGAPRGDEQSESTINYEVDRNITHIQHHQGAIQRLSTAVVVNYRAERQKDGSVKQVPLDAATIKQVTDLVRQAVGFSAARGDTVEVVNSAFTAPASPDERPWWRDLDWIGIATKLGRWLLVLIAALVVYRRVLRPLQKRYLAAPLPASAGGAPLVGDPGHDAEPVAAAHGRKAASYEQRLTSLKGMAREDPGMVAMVIRSWMKRDGQ